MTGLFYFYFVLFIHTVNTLPTLLLQKPHQHIESLRCVCVCVCVCVCQLGFAYTVGTKCDSESEKVKMSSE